MFIGEDGHSSASSAYSQPSIVCAMNANFNACEYPSSERNEFREISDSRRQEQSNGMKTGLSLLLVKLQFSYGRKIQSLDKKNQSVSLSMSARESPKHFEAAHYHNFHKTSVDMFYCYSANT